MSVPALICIETETAGDSRSMFRLRVRGNVIAKTLTAVQVHLLVGEILERAALPRRGRAPLTAELECVQ